MAISVGARGGTEEDVEMNIQQHLFCMVLGWTVFIGCLFGISEINNPIFYTLFFYGGIDMIVGLIQKIGYVYGQYRGIPHIFIRSAYKPIPFVNIVLQLCVKVKGKDYFYHFWDLPTPMEYEIRRNMYYLYEAKRYYV